MKAPLFFLSIFLTTVLFGQADSTLQKPTLAVLPLVYFTPETSWAFGAGAVSNFKLGNQTINTFESQVTAGLAYTLFNQFLSFASWRIFAEENKHLFSGEIGWYDYVYFFYGIGNEVLDQNVESYYARFPRLRFDYLRQINNNLYVGLRYHFDDFAIKRRQAGGLLESGDFVGSQGGTISGLGPIIYLDNRDSQLYPTSGMYAESSLQWFASFLGSDFVYWRWLVDLRKVKEIATNQVMVWSVYHESIFGEAPFFAIPLMGGPRNMRGLFEGKYREQNMSVLQAEYRWKILSRWGLAGFAGLGNVYGESNPLLLQNTKIGYGIGGRFQLSKREKLNLRLDLGHSPGEGLRVYLTFGEAF